MRILFFAQVRDTVGCPAIDWPEVGSLDIEELWQRLLQEFPGLERHRPVVRLARNGVFLGDTETLQAHDEIALIPPVSGG